METSKEFDSFINDQENLELVPIGQITQNDVVYFYGRNFHYRCYDHCLYPTRFNDDHVQYIKLAKSVTHLWRNKILPQLQFNYHE